MLIGGILVNVITGAPVAAVDPAPVRKQAVSPPITGVPRAAGVKVSFKGITSLLDPAGFQRTGALVSVV
jgi:hypothetical protein